MELFRALGALAESPSAEAPEIATLLELGQAPAEGEYERLFLFQLYPYASVYLGPEGQLGGDARDRIAGFWRALELEPPPEPDHLTLMLGLYARLGDLEAASETERTRTAWAHARKAWFWEHLASWLPVYLGRFADIAGDFYGGWSQLLLDSLASEAGDLGPPEALPLHLREGPELEPPSTGSAADFLRELLSPVRTGFVLLESDLHTAAGELELVTRAGERRFVIEALLGQNARATLDWLARFARQAAERYRHGLTPFAPIDGFWIERAERAAELLNELACDAPESAG